MPLYKDRLKTQWNNLLQIPFQWCFAHIKHLIIQLGKRLCLHVDVCMVEIRKQAWNHFSHLLPLFLCIVLICWLEIVITWQCITPFCCIWMTMQVLWNPWELWFYHKLWHRIQYDLFIKTWLYNIYHLKMWAYIARPFPTYFKASVSMLPHPKEKNTNPILKALKAFWFTKEIIPSHWKHPCNIPLFPSSCSIEELPKAVFLISASQPLFWLLVLWYVKLGSKFGDLESEYSPRVFEVWPSQNVGKFELVEISKVCKSGYFTLKSR